MDTNKKTKKIKPPEPDFFKKGSKWQELANFISRKNREFSILNDFQKDPYLKKIHSQRDKMYSKKFPSKK